MSLKKRIIEPEVITLSSSSDEEFKQPVAKRAASRWKQSNKQGVPQQKSTAYQSVKNISVAKSISHHPVTLSGSNHRTVTSVNGQNNVEVSASEYGCSNARAIISTSSKKCFTSSGASKNGDNQIAFNSLDDKYSLKDKSGKKLSIVEGTTKVTHLKIDDSMEMRAITTPLKEFGEDKNKPLKKYINNSSTSLHKVICNSSTLKGRIDDASKDSVKIPLDNKFAQNSNDVEEKNIDGILQTGFHDANNSSKKIDANVKTSIRKCLGSKATIDASCNHNELKQSRYFGDKAVGPLKEEYDKDSNLPNGDHPDLCHEQIGKEGNGQKYFDIFIDFLFLQMMGTKEEKHKIVKRLKSTFSLCEPLYVQSSNFSHLVDETIRLIKVDVDNIFVHVYEFLKELKCHKAKKKKTPDNVCSSTQLAVGYFLSEPSISAAAEEIPVEVPFAQTTSVTSSLENPITSVVTSPFPSTSVVTSPFPSTSVVPSPALIKSLTPSPAPITAVAPSTAPITPVTPPTAPTTSVVQSHAPATSATKNLLEEKKKEKLLKKLWNRLEQIDKKIKQLQERELSVDDLDADDSAYLREDKLKKCFVKTYNIICKHEKCSNKAQREIYKKFHYNGTQHAELNKSVEDLINKKRIFPDYTDIYNLVNTFVKQTKLRISLGHIEDLAREVFSDVGKELKLRRKIDDESIMLSYVNDTQVPPVEDEDLKSRLDENAEKGIQKMKQVLDEYVAKQYAYGEEPLEVPEASSPGSSSDSNIEEDNESDGVQTLSDNNTNTDAPLL